MAMCDTSGEEPAGHWLPVTVAQTRLIHRSFATVN